MNKKFSLIFLPVFLLCCLPYAAQAQVVKYLGPGAKAAVGRGVVNNVSKGVSAAVGRSMSVSAAKMPKMTGSVVQVLKSGSEKLLGTAFITKEGGRTWVVMPHHVGGPKGAQRTIRAFTAKGKPVLGRVVMAAGGNDGLHAADVSIGELPKELEDVVTPLTLGEPELTQPIFSFGYTSQNYGVQDMLRLERHFLDAEGFLLTTDRFIEGERVQKPIYIGGYCGSPLMQYVAGEWRVVGMHTGSWVKRGFELSENRSYAVNLARTLPFLLNQYRNSTELSLRPLLFNGALVGQLDISENVDMITVIRAGKTVITQELSGFMESYSDESSEKVLLGVDLQPGDMLVYNIKNSQWQRRSLSYVIE